jgi:hypothetical protein
MADLREPVSSKEARRLILAGKAPAQMSVHGHLDLSGQRLRSLPAGLRVISLDLSGCSRLREIPADLAVDNLRLDRCSALESLPAHFACSSLQIHDGALRELPPGVRIGHKLDLTGCRYLEGLPEGLSVQVLILRFCTSLRALPASLKVAELHLGGCSSLTDWPGPITLRLANLSLTDCARLRHLPEGLQIDLALEVARSGLTALPASLEKVRLLWRGVGVDEQIVFRPETLTAQEVLTERNLERRRVMIERVGYDRLFQACNPQMVDQDRDPGGERLLLRVPFPGDEDLVCLSVRCPSTGRGYILRVPPRTQTCRQAAAWLAGFENADDYQPVVET